MDILNKKFKFPVYFRYNFKNSGKTECYWIWIVLKLDGPTKVDGPNRQPIETVKTGYGLSKNEFWNFEHDIIDRNKVLAQI